MTSKITKFVYGMIFLSVFLLISISNVSALYPCDWTTYGGEVTNMPNFQFDPACTSTFGTAGVTNINFSTGTTNSAPIQPLVAGLGSSSQPRLLYQAGNYTEVLNGNMQLVTEFFTGTQSGQMAVGDFDGNSKADDVAGIWYQNSSTMAFKVFKYNESADTMVLQYETNFTFGTGQASNGVRCVGNSGGYQNSYCWTTLYYKPADYSYYLYQFYTNGSVGSSQLIGTGIKNAPTEPVSFADYDNDGRQEVMVWSYDKILVEQIENNGAITEEWNMTRNDTVEQFRFAKFMFPTETQQLNWLGKLLYPNANKGRLVYGLECYGFGGTFCSYCGGASQKNAVIYIYKPDQTLQNSVCYTSTSPKEQRISGLAIADYNGDYKDDVWVYHSTVGFGNIPVSSYIDVYKGDDATSLYTSTDLNSSILGRDSNTFMTLAYLSGSSKPDAILTSLGNMTLYKISNSTPILRTLSTYKSCVPADLTYDGYQDVACVSSSQATLFTVNSTNHNPNITSVTISPSQLLSVGQSADGFISASDAEGDTIFYSALCGTGINVSETTTSTKSCTYTQVGIYNLTFQVRDAFHTTYNTASYQITVTQTGAFCNNDNVCDAGNGETYSNCPNDCPVLPSNQYTSSNETGGMPLPLQLVDTSQSYAVGQEVGLLPEIYYGTLGLFSNTLSPFIGLVFLFFIVLIIIAVGTFIRKVADKISR